MTLADQAAYLLTAAGVLAGGLGAAVTGRPRAALPMTLELWTAAGLLRLTADRSWSVVATAAALVVIRRLVARTLLPASRGGPSRATPPRERGG